MSPTPEQVAQWAREAGFFLYDLTETHGEKVIESDDKDQHAQLQRFATLACAWQAEQDAAICDALEIALAKTIRVGAYACATDIRANAPKVTM